MERRIVGILVLSGLYGFVSLHLHRYHLVAEKKSWLDAREYCREKHSDLATVNNEQDLEELAGLNGPEASQVFLGLHRRWGWSLSDADDHKQGELGFWNWARGEPAERKHYCGSIGETGEWFATNCSDSLAFFCYDGSKTDPSERFTLGNGSTNWLAAQASCRERHTDLARVRNRLENKELQRAVDGDRVWIGLTGASWAWSDGSEPSFIPWRPMRSSSSGPGDCGVLVVDSKPLGMVGGSCAEKLPFICSTDPLRKHVVRLTLTADDVSVDMADPAVMDSILKWVERKLSEEGATKDVNLSWRKFPEKEENQSKQTYLKKCV